MDKKLRKQQIREIYEYLKSIGRVHTQKEFAESISSNDECISNAMNGRERYLTDNLFRRIGYYHGDVFNKAWLDKLEGEMLVEQASGSVSNSTVVGNNVNGNGISIHNGNEGEALGLLRQQLSEKEKEIERLHQIIDKLMQK